MLSRSSARGSAGLSSECPTERVVRFIGRSSHMLYSLGFLYSLSQALRGDRQSWNTDDVALRVRLSRRHDCTCSMFPVNTVFTHTWRAMAKKKAAAISPAVNHFVDRANAASPTRLTVETKDTAPTTFRSLQGRPLPTVHVNNANLTELKNACDDAVKKVCRVEGRW